MGRAATYGKLMLALTRDNVNVVSPSEATALMIVAAGVRKTLNVVTLQSHRFGFYFFPPSCLLSALLFFFHFVSCFWWRVFSAIHLSLHPPPVANFTGG